MSHALQIIHASDFIRIGAEGYFDLPASKVALTDMARACRKRGLDHALLDLRDLKLGPKPIYSTQDLLELVKTFKEAGFTKNERLAILYRVDPFHRVRMFTLFSTLRGLTVRAFHDFEAAIDWLSNHDEAPRPARSAAAKTIPIQRQKTSEAKHQSPRATERQSHVKR